jgi:hypothetical protein
MLDWEVFFFKVAWGGIAKFVFIFPGLDSCTDGLRIGVGLASKFMHSTL